MLDVVYDDSFRAYSGRFKSLVLLTTWRGGSFSRRIGRNLSDGIRQLEDESSILTGPSISPSDFGSWGEYERPRRVHRVNPSKASLASSPLAYTNETFYSKLPYRKLCKRWRLWYPPNRRSPSNTWHWSELDCWHTLHLALPLVLTFIALLSIMRNIISPGEYYAPSDSPKMKRTSGFPGRARQESSRRLWRRRGAESLRLGVFDI
ncbi:hypothetical protein BXZ70DRAFT_911214 [Cristinia sonorae]|uniref:Uncharacterized protein n=1 Tax=Cristinia sonorae TaxID=1940300 RepID=A0A8K0UES8_9AGAR|nr:hypothetical protein BXZ70DRAFT_911214 [Cristinia sonorae]